MDHIVNGENVTKAHLVAHGFEDDDMNKLNSDSPTVSKESLRMALAIMSSKK